MPFEGYPAFNIAGPVIGQAFPTSPMKKKQLEVDASVLKFSFDREEDLPPTAANNPVDTEIDGFGFIASANYTFLENSIGLEWAIPVWGVSSRLILPIGEQGRGTKVITLGWSRSLDL